MKPIDRKACAAYFAPKLKLDTNSGVFHFEGIRYVIVTDIKIIGHRRLLLLYLLPREQAAAGDFHPSYIVFQATDQFVTRDLRPEAKTKWRTAALERLNGYDRFLPRLAFYTRADEERVIRFCRLERKPKSGLFALSVRQLEIVMRRTEKARAVRERKLAREMARIKPAGKRFEHWAKDSALPKYIVYQYSKGATSFDGICTACGQSVNVPNARHNLPCVCPACKRAVTLKSHGKSKNLTDRATVSRFDRLSKNELILRTFKVFWYYGLGRSGYRFYETARTIIQWDETGQISTARFWDLFTASGITSWRRGVRPQFSLWQKSFEASTDGFLWTGNIARVLQGTPWQYSGIGAFFENARISADAETYLAKYSEMPCIEYLVKLRLFRLTAYLVYQHLRGNVLHPQGTRFQEVLGVGMEDLPLLQELDASYAQLGILQSMRRAGLSPDRELLQWCDKYQIERLSDVSTPLKYMTPHKLVRYATEQFEANRCPTGMLYYDGVGFHSIRQMLGDYRDYLFMCEGQGYDMKNPFVLFPKNMKTAHDQVMKLSANEKAKIYNRQIADSYAENTTRYGFKKDGLMIVAPKSSRDITREGQALHHCVGTYVERMAKQECVILFLRRRSAPSKSFCTIEVSDGRIQQARANMNAEPPPEAKMFLEQWKKRVLERPFRREDAIPAALPQVA